MNYYESAESVAALKRKHREEEEEDAASLGEAIGSAIKNRKGKATKKTKTKTTT